MKKIFYTVSRIAMVIFIITYYSQLMGQPVAPPPGVSPGDQPIGGGAPIDGGLSVMLLGSLAYGLYRKKVSLK